MAPRKAEPKNGPDTTYQASSIKALDQHTHLLKRISLTFGPEEEDGAPYAAQKGVALREIVDNALDEARAGYGSNIKIIFNEDKSCEVQDSGRGIPVDIGQDAQGNPASGIYLSLGVIQSGGKFETDSSRYSSGLNGVGASSTVHLSKRADVTVYRDGKKYSLSFKDGTPGFFAIDDDPESEFTELDDYTKLKEEKDTRPAAEKKAFPTGTSVKIWLRDEVFSSDKDYDSLDIMERLKGTAYLVPHLNIEVINHQKKIENPDTGNMESIHEVYHFPEGLETFIENIRQGEPVSEPIHIVTEGSFIERNAAVLQKDGNIKYQNVKRQAPIEVIMAWNNGYENQTYSYVNTINTKLGGSHVKAFQKAIMDAWLPIIGSYRGLFNKKWGDPQIVDFLQGLDVIISVQTSEPKFSSQSKEEFSSREAQRGLTDALKKAFADWASNRKNEAQLRVIASKISSNMEVRSKEAERIETNKAAKQLKKEKTSDKLHDCLYAGKKDQKHLTELLICEGNSAAGGLVAGRDSRYNAVLGIRGKIINAYKSDLKSVLENAEVKDIITSIGAGIGEDFDLDKARYGRVIFVTDADPDGKGIAVLLYALMWRLFPGLIKANRVYAALPPLFTFVVEPKKKGEEESRIYAYTDKEREDLIKELDSKKAKYDVVRNKGLGEMEADELEETVIDKSKRRIIRLNSDDVEAINSIMETIMGSDIELRRQWINESDFDKDMINN